MDLLKFVKDHERTRNFLGRHKKSVFISLILSFFLPWIFCTLFDLGFAPWISMLVCLMAAPIAVFLTTFRSSHTLLVLSALPSLICKVLITYILSSGMDILINNPGQYIVQSALTLKESLICEGEEAHIKTLRSVKDMQEELLRRIQVETKKLKDVGLYSGRFVKTVVDFSRAVSGIFTYSEEAEPLNVDFDIAVDSDINVPSFMKDAVLATLREVQDYISNFITARKLFTFCLTVYNIYTVLKQVRKDIKRYPHQVKQINLNLETFLISAFRATWKLIFGTIVFAMCQFCAFSYSVDVFSVAAEKFNQPIIMNFTSSIDVTAPLYGASIKNDLASHNNSSSEVTLNCNSILITNPDMTYFVGVLCYTILVLLLVIIQIKIRSLRKTILDILHEINSIV